MSKSILDHSGEENQVSRNIVGRVVIIIGILLGGAHFLAEYGTGALGLSPPFERQANLGFFLFFVWLAVSSGIRAVQKLSPDIAVGWLFITGMGIGLWGQAVFSLLQWAAPRFRGEEALSFILHLLPGILPSLAVSLLVSVLTAITLRVENKLLAVLLRVLIFAALALLIYLWM
ncbi:MAG: hypothetical protein J5I94_25995 [Phaeodactylibacter sp.]|nr:hypothetical protein [Phaeodactylibacter sp.]